MKTIPTEVAKLDYKGMNRFTLRGKPKVDAQWKRFTLVHNIEKIANYGRV